MPHDAPAASRWSPAGGGDGDEPTESARTRTTETADLPQRLLLVSIHDVAPPLERQVRALWDLCRTRGITPALLVVPNWHGRAPLEAAPHFVQWVRRCADEGAEVLLHGERHDEHGLSRTWGDHWRAWGRTAGEGEFVSLDELRARERIGRGLALLDHLGLDAVGFVPPAWLARPGCWRAVGRAGLRLSEDASAVHLHAGDAWRRVASPVVRWSGRTSVRAHGSAAVAAARWHLQRRARYVRLALHPGDLAHAQTTRSMADALDRWRSDRPATSYTAFAATAGPEAEGKLGGFTRR